LLSARAGADEAGSDDAANLARYDAAIKPTARKHWAFQPVRQPPLPAVRESEWVRNPIDRFVLARLEGKEWQPAPPAEPRALLRRLYLDVIGLPPTPGQQEAFLRDSSPDALDRVVRDLLARPSHGERWARHWLDLVRYADTNGYERDAAKPHVWRYRDYVIRAFNEDKPFDRFILEQLAGDELPAASSETLIATGYYRLGPWDDEPADPQEDRFDQLDDMVSTTGEVFLGLTVGCARCHNHKFEPLTMHDYYRLVAVMNPLQRPQKGRTDLDLPTGEGVQRGYFLREQGPKAPPTQLLIRGRASRPGPAVAPGVPAVLVSTQPIFPPPGPTSSRRRLTLARWIASPNNPLTARVIVNRVWQHHFGEGLVRTPNDFGLHGDRPSHPELLDWLADRFVRDGWSLKKLHKLILTSNTYRMSKQWSARYAAIDPEDKFWWRLPYRRLDVEAIRDSILDVSGQLNRRPFGPGMFPHVPAEALQGSSDPDTIWPSFNEKDASRRTVYAFVKRSMIVPMMEVLDFADCTRSAPRRNVTSVATQALSLLNGDFVNRQARHLATRLLREVGTDPDRQIEQAYWLTLCRAPTPTELTGMRQFLDEETRGQQSDRAEHSRPLDVNEARQRALAQLGRVLFNSNEFVYPD
jgi:hypothetical protein